MCFLVVFCFHHIIIIIIILSQALLTTISALFNWLRILLTSIVTFYFAEAVADANKAIELDPSIPKAYLRKG